MYRLPPGVDYGTKKSDISALRLCPSCVVEFRLIIPLDLSYDMGIPVHGRVSEARKCSLVWCLQHPFKLMQLQSPAHLAVHLPQFYGYLLPTMLQNKYAKKDADFRMSRLKAYREDTTMQKLCKKL